MASCSNIAENERLIEVKPTEVKRAVLVEDYTGQLCVNCPKATDEITQLQKQYGADTIIAVGIHSGPFGHTNSGAQTDPRTPLCTETGDSYFLHWTGSWSTGQPCVNVNRTSGLLGTGGVISTAVIKNLSLNTPVQLSLNLESNNDSTEVSVKVSASSSKTVSGKLQIYVLEDGIIGTQYFPNGIIDKKYIHNHVFRSSITKDIYGDDISIVQGEENVYSYSFKIDKKWKSQNISVVAFIYDEKEGVLQAIKKHL